MTKKIQQRHETVHRYYTSLRKICQEKDASVARTKERKRLVELVLTYDEHVTDTECASRLLCTCLIYEYHSRVRGSNVCPTKKRPRYSN